MCVCKSNKDTREEEIYGGVTKNGPLSQLLTTSIADNSWCVGERSIF